MNVQVAPRESLTTARRRVAKAPWILVGLSPVVFIVLMETFEVLTMSGALPGIPDAVGLPIYFALVAALPATAIAFGVRAIRRGDRGLPWIPTILAILLLVQLAVMVVAVVVVG
jgi:fatty acid desaturase